MVFRVLLVAVVVLWCWGVAVVGMLCFQWCGCGVVMVLCNGNECGFGGGVAVIIVAVVMVW